MAADTIQQPGCEYHYNGAGTNTLTNVSTNEATLYAIDIEALGSPGYLQVYDNGSSEAGAGTPDLVFKVGELSTRNIQFGPAGLRLKGGLSYHWGTAATGTAAVAGNASVVMAYQGTAR